MRFEAIPPESLGRVWDFVSPGIAEIKRLCSESFRPEDVYHHIKRGTAFLYLIVDKEPIGFCVLEILTDPNDGTRTLNVWLLHLVNKLDGVREEILSFLDESGRRANCASVRFASPRKGWMAFLLDNEFKQKMIIYERVL